MARFIEDIFNKFYNYYSLKNNIDDCIDSYNKSVDEAEKIMTQIMSGKHITNMMMGKSMK